jgi:hypothetical protein
LGENDWPLTTFIAHLTPCSILIVSSFGYVSHVFDTAKHVHYPQSIITLHISLHHLFWGVFGLPFVQHACCYRLLLLSSLLTQSLPGHRFSYRRFYKWRGLGLLALVWQSCSCGLIVCSIFDPSKWTIHHLNPDTVPIRHASSSTLFRQPRALSLAEEGKQVPVVEAYLLVYTVAQLTKKARLISCSRVDSCEPPLSGGRKEQPFYTPHGFAAVLAMASVEHSTRLEAVPRG